MRSISGLGIIVVLLFCFVLAFSSFSATTNTAKVLGGSGTVDDPLKITVFGNAGLMPYIDSPLPFKAIPAIELSYEGESFYVPGFNAFFKDRNLLAKAEYLISLIFLSVTIFVFILRIAGCKIRIVRVKKGTLVEK